MKINFSIAFQSEKVWVFIAQNLQLFCTVPKVQKHLLLRQRQILKRTYGDLGDQLSENANRIFLLTKELETSGKVSFEESEDALILLQKAVAYSLRGRRLRYSFSLIKEYTKQNQKQLIEDLIKESKDLSPLLYNIYMFQVYKQELPLDKTQELLIELADQEKINIFRLMCNEHQQFFNILVNFVAEESMKFVDFEFFEKEARIKYVLPQILDIVKEKGNVSFDKTISDMFISKDQAKLKIKFNDNCNLDCDIFNYEISGKIRYDAGPNHFYEDILANNNLIGNFKYQKQNCYVEGVRNQNVFNPLINQKQGTIQCLTPIRNLQINNYGVRQIRQDKSITNANRRIETQNCEVRQIGLFEKNLFTGRQIFISEFYSERSFVFKNKNFGGKIVSSNYIYLLNCQIPDKALRDRCLGTKSNLMLRIRQNNEELLILDRYKDIIKSYKVDLGNEGLNNSKISEGLISNDAAQDDGLTFAQRDFLFGQIDEYYKQQILVKENVYTSYNKVRTLIQEIQYSSLGGLQLERTYYLNGQLFKDLRFNEGIPHGECYYYYPWGEVGCAFKYDQGKLVEKFYESSDFSFVNQLKDFKK